MARQLHSTQSAPSTTQAGLAAASLLLCAFALFMCASHSRKRGQLSACYGFFDEDPVIQHNSEATMQTTAFHEYQHGNGNGNGNGDESIVFSCEQQQGGSIWQKNILMGGKCQLPDFSGVIIYDADGNIVTPAKTSHPLLTWK